MTASLLSGTEKDYRPMARLANLVLLTALMLSTPAIGVQSAATAIPAGVDRAGILERYGELPLSFIENRGQADKRVAYYLRSPGYELYFTPHGHALRFTRGRGADAMAHIITVELIGAATERVESREIAPGIVSYFKGPEPQWHTAIPTHTRIGYVRPWPGIDLVYDGHGGKLESIYAVGPHADPGRIRLRYSGQQSLRVDDDGNLVCTTELGELKETAPVLYQQIDGSRVPVEGRYRLVDKNTVSFDVAQYDRDHTLIIDPTLVYAGFIGGSGDDVGYAIAVDGAGSVYVTGSTSSTEANFPVAGGPDATANGLDDAFVAKLNAAGTALVYAGFIGGSGADAGFGIAVDGAGNAYVTGNTESTQASFPVVGGPDLTANGLFDAFVAKVNANGTALIYAGFVGGGGSDRGNGIAVDSAGNAYVSGNTAGFPAIGGPDTSYNGGGSDAFVAKVSPSGATLIYAGFIGGNGTDEARGIAVDSGGSAYVTGLTGSSEASFPVLVGPDLSYNGGGIGYDAFVAKVNATGTALVYAGYIGGNGDEGGSRIAVDSTGSAYVAGFAIMSSEASFPVLVGPDLTYNGGLDDAFVAKVNPAGTALVYAGFIGGSNGDSGTGIAVDNAGNAYVSGSTRSNEVSFPVLVGPDLSHNGGTVGYDAFVAKVNPTGAALVYAGYVGGSDDDIASSIAIDSAGNAYITGNTRSTEASFPVLGGPGLNSNGGVDAFVAKISATGIEAPIFGDGFE